MLKPRSAKDKNRLLLVGVMCFSVLVYFLSISKTVDLYQKSQRLRSQVASLENAPETLFFLKRELAAYEVSLAQFRKWGVDWEERLLHEVAKVCQANKVTLIKLPPPVVEEQNNYVIFTRPVKLQGRYRELVQVIHELEKREAMGRISSVRFSLEVDRNSRTTSLFVYVYIQHIEKGGAYVS